MVLGASLPPDLTWNESKTELQDPQMAKFGARMLSLWHLGWGWGVSLS